MGNNILYLCSFLNAQDNNKVSIWDSLCYLVSKIIVEKSISDVTIESICKNFTEYYGYNIPMHPMKELFNKMLSSGYLITKDIRTCPDIKKMKDLLTKNRYGISIFDNLVAKLREFFLQEYDKKKSNTEIENLLIYYLNTYHTNILDNLCTDDFCAQSIDTQDDIYIVNDFIFKNINYNTEEGKVIENLVISIIHLSSIFYSTSNKNRLQHNSQLFLDTRIILRLLGFEGSFRKSEYENFLNDLNKSHCSLFIFRRHYEEVENILSESIRWLRNKDSCNLDYASPTLRYFIEEHYDATDVSVFLAHLESNLKKYKIKIKDYDYDNTGNDVHTIDEKNLFELIKKQYNLTRESFDYYEKDLIIWNDVSAISSIYRMRKGEKYNSFSKVKYAFLTTNAALARASRLFEKNNDQQYRFQECMTDSYYGTYFWLTTDSKDHSMITKKILASSYDYLRLNPKIITAFHEIVEKKRNSFDEETYHFLKEGEACKEILGKMTQNNIENITDALPEEILNSYKNKIKNEAIQASKEEINDLSNSLENEKEKNRDLLEENLKFERQENSIKEKLRKSSNRTARIVMFIFAGVFFGLIPLLFFFYPNFILYIISGIITLIFTYFGISLKVLGKFLSNHLYKQKCKKFFDN